MHGGRRAARGSDPTVIDSAGIELDDTLLVFDYLNGLRSALEGAAPPLGPSGAAAAFDRSAFLECGGFDERLFAYWEDVDLVLRLRLAGARCVLVPDARAVHAHSATLGSGSAQELPDGFGRGYVLRKWGVVGDTGARVVPREAGICAAQLVVDRTPAGINGRLAGWRAADAPTIRTRRRGRSPSRRSSGSSAPGDDRRRRCSGRRDDSAFDVVVVSYRCRDFLRRCLTSLALRRGRRPGLSTTLRTTGRSRWSDGVPRRPADHERPEPRIRRATNTGIREGSGPYVLALNPDAELRAGTLDGSSRSCERPEVGICGCRLERPDGSFDHASRRSFPTPLGALGHLSGFGRRRAASARSIPRAEGRAWAGRRRQRRVHASPPRRSKRSGSSTSATGCTWRTSTSLTGSKRQGGRRGTSHVTALHVKHGTSPRRPGVRLTIAFYRGHGSLRRGCTRLSSRRAVRAARLRRDRGFGAAARAHVLAGPGAPRPALVTPQESEWLRNRARRGLPDPLPLVRERTAGSNDRRRRGLVVAGMHRSGTSAVARVLGLLGAKLPERSGAAGVRQRDGFLGAALDRCVQRRATSKRRVIMG